MAIVKPKINKLKLYQMIKDQLLLMKDRADGIMDWEGIMGVAIEQIDGTFINEAFNPVLAKLDELIAQAQVKD